MELNSTKRDTSPLANALFGAILIKNDMILQVSTQRRGDMFQAFRQILC